MRAVQLPSVLNGRGQVNLSTFQIPKLVFPLVSEVLR
jgi:hypothetical protein